MRHTAINKLPVSSRKMSRSEPMCSLCALEWTRISTGRRFFFQCRTCLVLRLKYTTVGLLHMRLCPSSIIYGYIDDYNSPIKFFSPIRSAIQSTSALHLIEKEKKI